MFVELGDPAGDRGYLLIVLQTVHSPRTLATPNRLNFGFDTGSFLSSAMSEMHFASASGSMQTVASSSAPGGNVFTFSGGVWQRSMIRTGTLNDETIEEEEFQEPVV